MVFRQRYYFEREHEKPRCRYTSGAAVRLVDGTKLARHAAAIRPASLITDEPASTLGLRTSRQHMPTASRAGARRPPSSSDHDEAP